VGKLLKETQARLAALVLLPCAALLPASLPAQSVPGPPPSTGGIFPLSEVHRGLRATAWTVFTGTTPEPMDVEILGVLRGGRGPGEDMILVQLHGAKPEYTGVVAGMSGSPVYVGNKLLGSLSYRIGQFSKDPIAGITPIEQMMEVRNLPIAPSRQLERASTPLPGMASAKSTDSPQPQSSESQPSQPWSNATFQAMETPLLMSGFSPEAIQLWQKRMAGTGLDVIAAGGIGGSSAPSASAVMASTADVVPGSAVSAELVRGDMEIAATCTVTYIDPKQLLACGHPILQAGPVSLPMTKAEVLATLASPLNAFKIINTGDLIGTFTEDRDAAIRGVLGSRAHMIPLHVTVDGPGKERKLNVEVLDLPALTPQAVLIVLFQALLQNNDNTAETSYHLTGSIDMDGYSPAPLDIWAPAGEGMPAPMTAALETGERFSKIYSNNARQGAVRDIDIHVETIPRRIQVELQSARLISGNIVHAGDTIAVEATVRPWHEPARNIRIPITLPSRLGSGNLRILVSDAGTLDRTRDQPRLINRPVDVESVLSLARSEHSADHIYVSLLMPETQASMEGKTLSGLPLSVANALEPLRSGQAVSLNGESAVVAGAAPAGGVLNGFQVLNLRIEDGGGVN
jgi:hypothetical protein